MFLPWTIGSIARIPVRLHWSFFLVAGVWVYLAERSGGSGLDYGWSFAFVLMLILSVLLHELGHALCARYFGLETLDVTLSPLGGLARFRGYPTSPTHDLWIAAAGPLTNLLIALPLLLVWSPERIRAFWWEYSNGIQVLELRSDSMLLYLLGFNFLMFAFNLLPAFPLDGGRILRALLQFRFDRLLATRVATRIGQSFGIGLIALSLSSDAPDYPLYGFGLFGGFLIYLGETEYRGLRYYEQLKRREPDHPDAG